MAKARVITLEEAETTTISGKPLFNHLLRKPAVFLGGNWAAQYIRMLSQKHLYQILGMSRSTLTNKSRGRVFTAHLRELDRALDKKLGVSLGCTLAPDLREALEAEARERG